MYITTAQSPRTNSKDRPYVFSVQTALHSAFLPKVTQVRCRHSRQMKPEIRMEIDGRLSILLGKTPTGETFKFMNIYQLTASNPTGQTEMWNTTENWTSKQKNCRIIMHGDLNSAHSGCQWDYAQPLFKDIGTADNKLQNFLSSTVSGTLPRTTGTYMEGEVMPSSATTGIMLLHGTITFQPMSRNRIPNHTRVLTIIKFGRSSPVWTSPNKHTLHGTLHRTSPSELALSSLNNTRTTGSHGSRNRSWENWKRTRQTKHWPT